MITIKFIKYIQFKLIRKYIKWIIKYQVYNTANIYFLFLITLLEKKKFNSSRDFKFFDKNLNGLCYFIFISFTNVAVIIIIPTFYTIIILITFFFFAKNLYTNK